MNKLPSLQRGLGLATALFVITAMALLAVLINQLVRSGAQSTEEELNLVRAFFAAQSGVEYGLNRAFPPDDSDTACPTVHDTSVDFAEIELGDDGEGLAQCSMEVSCHTLIVEGDPYYTITSKGACGEVSRTVQVRAN